MAWSGSKIFTAGVEDVLEQRALIDVDTHTFKIALFDNTITPNQTGASAATAYGAAPWNAGGVSDSPSWPAVGRDLLSVTSAFTSNVYTFDAADTVSADATTDLAAVNGGLVYDDTITTPVADQGLCYLYFGGANSVVNGTFTVVYAATGIVQLTL